MNAQHACNMNSLAALNSRPVGLASMHLNSFELNPSHPKPFMLSLSKRGARLRQAQPERGLKVDKYQPINNKSEVRL